MVNRMSVLGTFFMVSASLAIAACGGSSSESEAPTTTTAPAETTSTVQVKAQTYAEAVTSRLGIELGDAKVAASVVAKMDAESLAALETQVPASQVATSELFRYRPKRGADEQIDSVVVFSFGNRVASDGATSSGPTNEALANSTAAFVKGHPVPVYAQWEVAEILGTLGVANVVSIKPGVGADGKEIYLSTAGVADKAVQDAGAASRPLGTVGVICFADHAVRCVLTAETAGMDAVVPKGADLPDTYDPQSGQSWTRDRATFISTDLTARRASFGG